MSTSNNVGIGTTNPQTTLDVNGILNVGTWNNVGTAINITTYGLERSRYTLQFPTYRDVQNYKIGAKIVAINKQTYADTSARQAIQSTDLAFFTTPPDTYTTDSSIERLRITDTGNVGIGTTSPTATFTVYNGDIKVQSSYGTPTYAFGGGMRSFVNAGTNSGVALCYADGTATGALQPFMYVCDSLRVGIGTSTPGAPLHVGDGTAYQNGTTTITKLALMDSTVATNGTVNIQMGKASSTYDSFFLSYVNVGASSASNYAAFNWYNGTTTLAIQASGNVGIGTTSPSYKLHISAGDVSHTLYGPNTAWGYYLACGSGGSQITSTTAQVTVTNGNLHLDAAYNGAAGRGLYLNGYTANFTAGGNGSFVYSYGPWTHTGNFTVTGGTKSFRIPHPVVPNKDLIHSCIEGPRNDLMYRGTVTLVNGTATVDMNKNSTTTPDCAMTDGTFEALCTNPQFFLQNMSGFDRIRGTMSGANLIIISENQNSADVISWMVVAERHDAAMISTDLTNDSGYLVTEQDSLPPNPYPTPPPS